jgi:hypothetical protein
MALEGHAMTDDELLRLAAKAAGVPIQWGYFGFGQEWLVTDDLHGDLRPWRPLTDDGDALRLAIALGLRIDILRGGPCMEGPGVRVFGYESRRELAVEPAANNGVSLQVVTRRCIVRAAAEIGKNTTNKENA